MDDINDEKQETLDWLFVQEQELRAAADRLEKLRQRHVQDDDVLRKPDLDSLEAFGHNLEIDAMMFRRRLPD